MRLSALRIATLALLSTCCAAQSDADPTSWFRDITISAGQKLNSATCFFCSIHVAGELKEDATAQWGDIDVRGVIAGDAVAVAGSVHLYLMRVCRAMSFPFSATPYSTIAHKCSETPLRHGD